MTYDFQRANSQAILLISELSRALRDAIDREQEFTFDIQAPSEKEFQMVVKIGKAPSSAPLV
jgi:hypothetical protein